MDAAAGDCSGSVRDCIKRSSAGTYSSQSTATMRLMSETGRPTDVRTRIIITSPALGILAAPILARVAVRLHRAAYTIQHNTIQ